VAPCTSPRPSAKDSSGTLGAFVSVCLSVCLSVQVCEMPDDDRPLGFYGVRSGMEIHVIDTDPFSLARGGGLDDVSQVGGLLMNQGKVPF
jgi:hypothetical protein